MCLGGWRRRRRRTRSGRGAEGRWFRNGGLGEEEEGEGRISREFIMSTLSMGRRGQARLAGWALQEDEDFSIDLVLAGISLSLDLYRDYPSRHLQEVGNL